MVADPVRELIKASKAKDAPSGRKVEQVQFSGEQSKVFERIGLDLIEVHPSGAATVHGTPEKIEQLRTRAGQLAGLGVREQARFVSIDSFDWIPAELKFDRAWVDTVGLKPVEAYIKLQPMITEIEADILIRSLERFFAARPVTSLRGKGRSYIGRYFLRALVGRQAVEDLANEFTSVQSIHPPIIALAQTLPPSFSSQPTAAQLTVDRRTQATIAVVDTAIPQSHRWLQVHRRATVTGPNCSNTENDNHGSLVASRVVFGDANLGAAERPPGPICSFVEVRVGTGKSGVILAESVANALQAALNAAPDVRVFNLSFDSELGLDLLPPRQRAETVRHIEEIDTFAFEKDVLLIIAAGNVPEGTIPAVGYPNHFNEPAWSLHSFPRAFNALTCGGIVSRLSAGGLADEIDAPSPFSRLGPGFARSPKPDFCASAGNADANYTRLNGSGVWGYSALGEPREVFGTSFAAPLLAREAAFIIAALQRFCPNETRPFACMAKAALAISAQDIVPQLSEPLKPLAKRAVGFGRANARAFETATLHKARFFWQGLILHRDDLVRVQVPVPVDWLRSAKAPHLRMCVSWDTPVSAAAEAQWACRDVSAKLHPGAVAAAIHGSRGGRIPGYPLFERHWDLGKARDRVNITDDLWVASFSYSQIAAYGAGQAVLPSQRIAFAAEIWDAAERPVNPHRFIQALPIAQTLSRFSNTAAFLPHPLTITTDF
jgi:hypothetical protein